MGISREQALDCFRSDDLVGIGMEADAVRRRLHPEGIIGYVIQARIECAAQPGSQQQEFETAFAALADAVDRGATAVRIANTGDARRTETLLREIRQKFSGLWIESLAPAQLASFAGETGFSLRDTIARLIDAGLSSIAQDGINLANSDEAAVSGWLGVHRAAHELAMPTIAGFIFAAGETAQQRLDFFAAVRRLQEATGGFAAFAPEAAAAPNGRELDGVTAVERLKTLAIARMFLDSIENVQASATPQSLKVLQMGLRFGANDAGPVAPASGLEEDVRRIIRDAGFRPAQREIGYRAMVLL